MVDLQVLGSSVINTVAVEFVWQLASKYLCAWDTRLSGWSLLGTIGAWMFVLAVLIVAYPDSFRCLTSADVFCGVCTLFRFVSPWLALRIVWLPMQCVICVVARRVFRVRKCSVDVGLLSTISFVIGFLALVLSLANSGCIDDAICRAMRWVSDSRARWQSTSEVDDASHRGFDVCRFRSGGDGCRLPPPSSAPASQDCIFPRTQHLPQQRQLPPPTVRYCAFCRCVPCRCHDCFFGGVSASGRQSLLKPPSYQSRTSSGQRRTASPDGCRGPPYLCRFCGRDCRAPIGLISHELACGGR